MKKLLALAMVLILALGVACGSAATTETMEEESFDLGGEGKSVSDDAVYSDGATGAPAPMIAPAPEPAMDYEIGLSSPNVLPEDRMIVRSADMTMVVNDVAGTIDQIAALADGSGGYVVSSQRWQIDERLAGTIRIRIPADDFTGIMGALRNMAVDVTHENTSSQDVTEEYTDLSAKLTNLEATEQQYLRLMEKAELVEDMLSVQRELSRTREDIERTKGRMQYLEQTAAMSLISVYLSEAQLYVQFQANDRAVQQREKVEFRADVEGGTRPYSYEWDFGDGETGSTASPTHDYKTAGRYDVSLKVTDDEGNSDTVTRDDYIVVSSGWSAGSAAGDAWDGLVVFGQKLVDVLIWLGVFSPFWIIAGIVFWRWRRRRRLNKQA